MSLNATNPSRTFDGMEKINISSGEFAEIAKLVYDTCGIHLVQSKQGLVSARLQKRLRILKLASYTDYIDHMESETGACEKEEMISAITTNVTDFAREPHHFTHFKNQVLPDLMDKARNGGSVRLWSAGCSNGSEPFTLACAVLDAFPDVGNYDFRILATDIDKYSINTAKSGEYKREMVEKLPKETVGRWFSRSGDLFKIDDRVRDLVHFKILNLVDQWPLQKKYDVIFCRNVLIYFTQEDQGKIIERFSQYMNPYSYLYIGHSERIIGKTATMFKSTGVTAYRYEPVGNKH